MTGLKGHSPNEETIFTDLNFRASIYRDVLVHHKWSFIDCIMLAFVGRKTIKYKSKSVYGWC